VKPGGTLVYAVCSLEPEEGEGVAQWFLANHGAFEPQATPPVADWAGQTGQAHMVRIKPGTLSEQGGADGFFVAMFHRKDES
jgi:16S rRNA (cytosine967-C5)-methyltransferase